MSKQTRTTPLPRTYTPKRDSFYFFEGLYTRLVCRLLPSIARTGVSPNQVTLLNIANSVLIVVCLWQQWWLLASVLIQLYLFLDIVDGNLARYAQLSSRFGQILDQIADRLFYTLGFVAIGYFSGNTTFSLVVYAIAINAYAWITTFHIVPRLRALPTVERTGIKKWFMDRKVIYGMDLSTQDVIASILLLSIWRPLILPLVTLLYSADLLYRLMELRRNEAKYPTSRMN